jgi:DNA-binding GntR family transcriptional regulator
MADQTIPPLTDHGETIPIAHQNLDEKVYDHLHGLIARRQLAPGTRLTLDSLARSLGVSRTPVINALKRLTQEQYVAWMPRHGIYVRQFSSRELAELYEIRAVLEGLSIRLGTQRITNGELAELISMLPSTPPRETAAALRRYVEVDRRFHWRLVELSGNDQLARTMKTVSLLIFSYQEGLARSIVSCAGTTSCRWNVSAGRLRRSGRRRSPPLRGESGNTPRSDGISETPTRAGASSPGRAPTRTVHPVHPLHEETTR